MFYEGGEFIIREWKKGDEPFLAHHANNINIWRCLDDSFPSPYTYDDALVFIEKNSKIGKPINFAIVFDDDPIGNINITYGQGHYKSKAKISIWISEEYWGQGIATKSIGWVTEFCFLDSDINLITASVFSNNKLSKKIFINNGYILKTVIKDSICKENTILDELIFIKEKQFK